MQLHSLILSRSSFIGSLIVSATTNTLTVTTHNHPDNPATSAPPPRWWSHSRAQSSPPSPFGTTQIIATSQDSNPPDLPTASDAKFQDRSFSEFATWFRSSIHDQIVQSAMSINIKDDSAMLPPTQTGNLAGPLIRLAFHDATTFEPATRPDSGATGGANGSIQYELGWSENRGLSRPLRVVQATLDKWKQLCRSNGSDRMIMSPDDSATTSLADAIALAGAQAVESAGGPHIPIRLGRFDGHGPDPKELRRSMQMRTDRSLVTTTMPSAGLDSDGLRLYFGRRMGLSEMEWIALCGIHGLGRHVSLLGMTKPCLRNLTRACLEDAPVLLPFVTSGVDRFDNSYFQFLLLWHAREIELGQAAFIPTDVALVVDPDLRRKVQMFAKDDELYRRVFAKAYRKLVENSGTDCADSASSDRRLSALLSPTSAGASLSRKAY